MSTKKTTDKPWSSFVFLQNAQQQSQESPNQSNPLSSGSHDLVQAASLALAQVSIAIASDSTQAGLLAGLQQNRCNQRNACQALQDNNNNLNNFHFLTSLHGYVT